MAGYKEKALILCKTYPSPSSKYVELSCVAAALESGELIRLFPVPFRLLKDDAKFAKWQWVEARIEHSKDGRPESHYIKIDTIEVRDKIGTENFWQKRRDVLSKLPTFASPEELEAKRLKTNHSLGLIKPEKIIDLLIKPCSAEWGKENIEKLMQAERQASFFEEERHIPNTILEKIPFDFYYTYKCSGSDRIYKSKIIDWEAGASYLKFKKLYGDIWIEKFKQKYLYEFQEKDIYFIMGNHNRFRHQWMIISLIYPPNTPPKPQTMDLFA